MSIHRRQVSVLFLLDRLAFGGTPLQVLELACNLDRRRFLPTFVLLSTSEPKLAEELQKQQIRCIALGRSNWVERAALGDIYRLYRLLRELRPDVLHAFLATSNALGAITGKLAGIPARISSHRDLGGFDGNRITRLNFLADRWLISTVTANSMAVARSIEARGGVAARNIRILYNGVRVPELMTAAAQERKRIKLGVAGVDQLIVIVANIRAAKGHRFAIEAFNRIADRYPRAKMLICGYTSDLELLADLRHLVERAGTRERVLFLGSRSDVSEIMQVADFLVAPSLSEGFSNAILEAMAVARPVVATAIGGNVEQVLDRITGLLVPAHDAEALAQAYGQLLDSPELRMQMGAAARKRVLQKFSIAQMIRAYEQLYTDLLSRNGTLDLWQR